MKAAHAKGHTLKHSRAKKTKHSSTTKHHPVHHAKTATKHVHHVTAKAKHATHAKARGFSLATGDVACCTAEALATSLRCQGLSVPDYAVLDLFRLAGGDEDAGAPILTLLETASESGLAGIRLARFEVADHGEVACAGLALPDHRSLILGVDLPGPHAVLATPEGWWSWGGLWCPCEFPGAVIEEAWAIEWAVAA